MDFEAKSRVYIIVDEQNRVTQIEGEYSLSNIPDLAKAILVEEGAPCDRLNHAQGNYLPKPLYTEEGLYRYKWTGAKCVLRTDAEIEADRAARPAPAPTAEEQLRAEVDALNAMLAALLRGETEAGNADAE